MDIFTLPIGIGILTLFLLGLTTASYKWFKSYTTELTVSSLLAFSAFWTTLFPYYVFYTRSAIYGLFIGIGVPATVYIAYQYYQTPAEYTTMSYIITFMFISGTIYAPFELFTTLRQASIEFIAYQTYYVLQYFGVTVELVQGPEYGYMSALAFEKPYGDGQLITYIEPACTGIGSMAVIGSLIATANISQKTKLFLLPASIILIHILNIIRNVFIAAAFGLQWFQFKPEILANFLGYSQASLVSFFIADKIIAQLLSAVVLIGLIYTFTVYFPQFESQMNTLLDEWTTPAKDN
jgi:archaeosortase A (PGF-CTERM-specific)